MEKDNFDKFFKNKEIKVSIKLPNWFKTENLIDKHNPNWSILSNEKSKENILFIHFDQSKL